MATALAACNSNPSTNNNTDKKDSEVQNNSIAKSQQPLTADTVISEVPLPGTAVIPVKEIIAAYLQVKNALTKDNSKDAALAANVLVATLNGVTTKSLPKEQMNNYMDIAEDLKENGEHIGSNESKIDHQREHFELLSKDIADLIKMFGNGEQTLYKDFCPMANGGKGAFWISEFKEIKNPYLGNEMPECGSVKETIK